MSYLAMLLILSALIVAHELGHLLAARAAGIPVAGFSIGLGPAVLRRRWRGIEWCLRALPLGGFVVPGVADEAEFRSIALRRRVLFFLGGPAANLAVAVGLALVGRLAGQGASLSLLWAPFADVARDLAGTAAALASLPAHPQAVAGPVGILALGAGAVSAGMAIEVARLLSVSLALFNLLPLPVLDGGQIAMACLEERFPPLTRVRVAVTAAGLVLLAGLMVLATVQDVGRLLA